MPPTTTPAIILHAFPYGESSKIARLLTRDYGVQSVIAKGASRPKSKFGARLQVLNEGTAQLYLKPNRDLHTLAEFDVTHQRHALPHDVRRYTAAAAFAEVVLRCCPAEAHPEVFDLTTQALEQLETCDVSVLDVVALGAMWAAVRTLGFAPRRDACARDGRRLPTGAVTFSVAEGGYLCEGCARGVEATRLSAVDRQALEHLVNGDLHAVGLLSPKHAAAHRRLLARFVERHMGEGKELRAMTLWQELT
ncbi:MAG: DNA repair protein RecO [Gemmatimonadota bacterium]|nr:DNA repair protein RecO [Gemmatimonadota bacterium]